MRVVRPDETFDTLEQHILVDGFHVVVDQQNSAGSWIRDARQNEEGEQPVYLDLYSQFASQALGWNHPALITGIPRLFPALHCKMANSDMYTTQYAEFVETFASITPDFKHYFFVDGGALAVENALKCAFDWKAKKIGLTMKDEVDVDFSVIHLKNAFHGRSGYTMSLTNTGFLKTGFLENGLIS